MKNPAVDQLTLTLELGVFLGLSISCFRGPYVIHDPFYNSRAFAHMGLQLISVKFLQNTVEIVSMYLINS